jgi:hypothetical protein
MPEIMLDMTLWADKPTTIPLTPPTVSRGWMLIPRTCRVARHPPKMSTQEARPEKGRTTRSIVLSCSMGSRSMGSLLVTDGERVVLKRQQRQGYDRQNGQCTKGSKGRDVAGRMGGTRKAAKAGT